MNLLLLKSTKCCFARRSPPPPPPWPPGRCSVELCLRIRCFLWARIVCFRSRRLLVLILPIFSECASLGFVFCRRCCQQAPRLPARDHLPASIDVGHVHCAPCDWCRTGHGCVLCFFLSDPLISHWAQEFTEPRFGTPWLLIVLLRLWAHWLPCLV